GYKHYEVVEIGFKYNMMDLQAAIGMHQIQRVEPYWLRRQEVWAEYERAFADLPVGRPAPFESDKRHALHLYTLLIDPVAAGVTRDAFMVALHRLNIGTGVHYRQIASHPVYQQRFGWRPEDYPVAQSIGERTVSLPLSAKLTSHDVESVIDAVRRALGR
ncbi:MAG TPA: DegT/DnrJ/EryC1/StrS family aminotransferase, partial [Chthoniobacteraceae bacterium]